MSQVNRLPQAGRLNRGKPIRFWYDNQGYEGYIGDSLASALLANGVHLIARSFKYHRPRGVYSAGAEEPNALVQLERGAYTEPNRRATEVELYDGLQAHSQNCWPTVGFDLGALSSKLSRLLPAGFYYKTFMWPPRLWPTYEKYIRKAAGLGHAPRAADPHAYDKTHAHCDVLVVGGGPAGLQAAAAAAHRGARVILVDEKSEFGGTLLSDTASIDAQPAMHWVDNLVAELRKRPDVTLLARTTVTGYYDYNFLIANQRVAEHLGGQQPHDLPKERLWKIRAKQVILATGAIERPLVFADNDRPGIMLAAALRTYINRYGVLPRRRVSILTNNDSAYLAAFDAKQAGARVNIIDLRPAAVINAAKTPLLEQARAHNIPIWPNYAVTGVDYARGHIRRIHLMQLTPDGRAVHGAPQTLTCELLAISGGWTPSVQLFSQARGRLQFDDRAHCFTPDPAHPPGNNAVLTAGAITAAFDLPTALSQGHQAGTAAAAACGLPAADLSTPTAAAVEYTPPRPLWVLPTDHPIGRGPKKHFHELHNDATIADIHLAVREGFAAAEHLKRYTTTGMGTDQGKTSNINALTVLAELRGVSVASLAPTTFRPPYTPLSFGSIVGLERRTLFQPQRKTALHAWHDQHGAIYEDVGDWKRPWYFPQPGETMHTAVQRETRAVRATAGLLDASTLGKLDVQGPDTLKLLNLLYTNDWSSLAIGRCRYGLMLNEHGMIFDDGVGTRLGEHHYHLTTTTGGAARVMNWLEEWLQTEWPELRVYCTSVTEQWAVAALNGPNSRAILQTLTDHSLDDTTFPFMSMRAMTIAGIPARVYRISFTGELAYEINVPARHALSLWQALIDAGQPHALTPYGTEAMHILRAEKGFIIVGQDTDGTVTPMDLSLNWLISKQKTDFFGHRAFTRRDTSRSDRKQLVGLLTTDPQFVLPEGAHVVQPLKKNPPMQMLGHVSSSYLSPNLGRSIALALIKDGNNRLGQHLDVALMDGSSQKAEVVRPRFL